MKRSLKAALLSGLLFPGLGELWLRYSLRGIVLAAAGLVSLYTITVRMGRSAYQILERIESTGGAVDLVAIADAARRSGSGDAAGQLAWSVLALCWVFSVVEAFLLGARQDREPKAKGRRRDGQASR